uniref:ERCC4 domain-containing protein EP364R n=1 Tax=Florenciella sp. virus SA2 TaxID=3240092 RepID=A0AB39JFF3_9VIRU
MEIICDYREHNIYDFLLKTIEKKECYKDIIVKKTNLNIGDFVIGNYIIERKTLSDLASSILDGRYKEQSSRLDSYLQEHLEDSPVIMYFIEGSLDLFINDHNVSKDKLISACISLMCNKNYKVFMTRHLNETCDFLLKLTLKSTNTNLNVCSNIGQNKYKKNSQINKDNVGIIMLTTIPNVSIHVATQLLNPFDNDIYMFLKEIRENPQYLDDMKIATKEGKERKLSKNIREKILELCA